MEGPAKTAYRRKMISRLCLTCIWTGLAIYWFAALVGGSTGSTTARAVGLATCAFGIISSVYSLWAARKAQKQSDMEHKRNNP